MNSRFAFVVGLSVVAVELLFASPSFTATRIPLQFEANKLSVSIATKTSYQRATNAITYEYQVAAAPASRQKLGVFAIAVHSEVITASAPTGWSGGAYRNRPLWSWTADDEAHLVAPGSSIGTLQLVSKGLPSIQASYAQGDTPIPNIEDVPSGMSEVEFATALDILSNSRKDVVSAPGNVTTEAPLLAVVQFLQQQTRAATVAQWLDARPSATSLDVPLAAAERAAQSGDKAGVTLQMQAFTTNLKAQNRRPGYDAVGMLLTIAEVSLTKAAHR